MIVGILRVELVIFESRSLKDKRRVIKSMKDTIAERYRVSIAEVDHLESPKRATLGVALVSNDSRQVHERFDKIADYIRMNTQVSLLSYEREFV